MGKVLAVLAAVAYFAIWWFTTGIVVLVVCGDNTTPCARLDDYSKLLGVAVFLIAVSVLVWRRDQKNSN